MPDGGLTQDRKNFALALGELEASLDHDMAGPPGLPVIQWALQKAVRLGQNPEELYRIASWGRRGVPSWEEVAHLVNSPLDERRGGLSAEPPPPSRRALEPRAAQERPGSSLGPTVTRRPSLAFYLSGQLVLGLTERSLFGGRKMPFRHLLLAELYLFQKGALLGRARSDRLALLAKLVTTPGGETAFAVNADEFAAMRLSEYGGQPTNFVDFIWKTEYRRAGVEYPSDYRRVMQLARQKAPLRDVEPTLYAVFSEGIAFGAVFPNLVSRMWRNTYEDIDSAALDSARRLRIDLPKVLPRIALKEAENEVLSETAAYVAAWWPELASPLRLALN
jgi:hypothetical protein